MPAQQQHMVGNGKDLMSGGGGPRDNVFMKENKKHLKQSSSLHAVNYKSVVIVSSNSNNKGNISNHAQAQVAFWLKTGHS